MSFLHSLPGGYWVVKTLGKLYSQFALSLALVAFCLLEIGSYMSVSDSQQVTLSDIMQAVLQYLH